MIYLDNNATSPLDPRVFAAMKIDLEGPPYNPSSVHRYGQKARALLLKARQEVASHFGFRPEEVIFTSGGTESINLFLQSLPRGHILSSNIEHSAVFETLSSLKYPLTLLSPDQSGKIDISHIESAIRPDTVAIVLSASNTETGAKNDLETIASFALQHRIPLFIDAVSYIGKEPFPHLPGITALALSAHKFHGPKGIGALLVRSTHLLAPLHLGGGQEFKKRSGTENLAGILGLSAAIQILKQEQPTITAHIRALRDRFESLLQSRLPNLIIHGAPHRICNVSNICFPNIDGEALLFQLDLHGIAASHGSACASGALEPSRVLLNMGLLKAHARSSIRFSFSRFNTMEEVEKAAGIICSILDN